VFAAFAATTHGQSTAQSRKPADSALLIFPDGVVAYWAFDGSRLGDDASRERALVAAGLRGLIGNAISIQGGSSVAGELIRGEVVGSFPYRACLLELEEQGGSGKVAALKPEKFAAVIEVRAQAKDHGRFQSAIDSALMGDARDDGGKPRTRTEMNLPRGGKGQVSSTGEAWRDVAWASLPEVFVVAFGEGALTRWLSATPGRTPEWAKHRAAVTRKRAGSVRAATTFEAYIDLNALRQSVPDEFDNRPLGNLIHSWHIANTRSFMVHGALVALDPPKDEKERTAAGPSVLAIDLSWSSRAEPPGVFGTISLSESTWPEGVDGRPEGSSWALVMRASVPTWIDVGADTYGVLSGAGAFDAARARWERRVKPMLEKIVPRIGEWAIMRPGPELTLQLKKADGADRLPQDVRALFSTLAPSVAAAGKGWELVAPEAEGALQGLNVRLESGALIAEWKNPK
jgi:hypothetical protein